MSNNDHHLALPPRAQVDEFRLERVLGSGGFGITYAATDTSLHRKVAIKEFFPNGLATRLENFEVQANDREKARDFTRQLRRFLLEATILAKLDHANIVKVTRYLEANGTAYFVMDYLNGVTLEKFFARRGGRPQPADILRVLLPILDGLELVHSRKLLHRDLKPDNILVVEEDRPVIIDFGVAKTTVQYSVSGEAFCSPGYTPFEQYLTHGDMGPWTDIYALGATVYKIITGKLPPAAPERAERDYYVPLVQCAGSSYPRDFLAAVDRALAVNVSDRPASVALWRQELIRSAGQTPAPRRAPEPAAPRKPEPPRPHVTHPPAAPAAPSRPKALRASAPAVPSRDTVFPLKFIFIGAGVLFALALLLWLCTF